MASYIFTDAVVFLTMPLNDRLGALGEWAIDEYVSPFPSHPGPNAKFQKKVKEAQRALLEQAAVIEDRVGTAHMDAEDLRSIPGAVVVPLSNIKRVSLTRHGLTRRAANLLFEMYARDPDVPFRERKRQRLFTFSRHMSRSNMDKLIKALAETFGDKFENRLSDVAVS
jgi:hypothetical protein